MPAWRCRWCGGPDGTIVLDLGEQPAADHFPRPGDPPDPRYSLRMVLCAACGLAQLEADPTGAEEPRGLEPAALVAQTGQAVADLAAGGFAHPGAVVDEHPSPHGGSWLPSLAARGMLPRADGPVDLLVDSLGMMHEPDQRTALVARASRLAPAGVLALHVHPLSTILRDGTWNALRHGHFAYYSVTWLTAAAQDAGLVPVGLWHYGLYGGTVVLAFARAGSTLAAGVPAQGVPGLAAELAAEAAAGVADPASVRALQRQVSRSTAALRAWLDEHGAGTIGYGAASRAVALLAAAGVTRRDLAAVVDASPAKEGRAMPGGEPGDRVPILAPSQLAMLRPDHVLLFVPDLLDEVRRAYPQVEARGGRWVIAEPVPVDAEPDA
ncbi:transferase [Xylanimonas protaetiae]|uniref:Transferase n=1 Tax=Xylanimonas protaetiae TaxID=2509457 RepID=A0A4P6FBK6_9MICO|nr:transferase [Xylanimonas protaetiae]